uniref:filensin n=1 Tax=Pristiophorus japonicus TaxID=55135 RepID=UPI00398E4564
MFDTSYPHDVRKENDKESDPFNERNGADFPNPGLEGLQEFNERFSKYISRARALEQSSGALRKQLESLRQIEELSGLEDAFTEQIDCNQQRIWELHSDLNHLEKELKDAQHALDEYRTKYRTECEYHEQLQDTIESLNKNANEALLKNLELQIRTQFLQEDINSTKERNTKNLAEIQSYMNVLKHAQQPTTYVSSGPLSYEEEEALLAEKRESLMKGQLDDHQSGPCQLQSQREIEMATLEQTIKSVQENYLDQMQLYNEQIEDLRKKLEEAEKSLERCANVCRRVVMYQQSLENELESYKSFIANEDYRSQSTPIETEIIPLSISDRYECTPESKDISLGMQYSTSIKPCQKGLSRKVAKKKDMASSDATADNGADQECTKKHSEMCEGRKISVQNEDEEEKEDEEEEFDSEEGEQDTRPDDVPDGAQISRIYDALCNMVRDRMRRHRRPELPVAEFYTKGHYVLVSGESSYMDPFFCTSIPSRSQVTVTFDNELYPGDMDSHPQPIQPKPLKYNGNGDGGKGFDANKKRDKDKSGDKKQDESGSNGEPKRPILSPLIPPPPSTSLLPDPSHVSDYKPTPFSGPSRPCPYPNAPDKWASKGAPYRDKQKGDEDRDRIITPPQPPLSNNQLPEEPKYRYYEKIEMIEAVETFTDNKLQGYEETSTIVETTVEQTNQETRAKRS